MKKQLVIVWTLFLLLSSQWSFQAQNLNFDWVKQFGAPGDSVTTLCMSADGHGNIYTLGNFSGTVDFDPGASTFTLSSVSASAYYPSGFICKLDSSGGFLWVKLLDGSPHYTVEDMAVDKHGDVYITGKYNYTDTIDIDPGPGVYKLNPYYYSTFVLKLNENGIFNWANHYGAIALNAVASIGLDSMQNVYTSGTFGYMITFFNSDTSIYGLTAPTWYTHVGAVSAYSNVYLCKMDSNGKFVFAVSRFALENDTGKAIVSAAGKSIMFGSAAGKGFAIKYDAVGNVLWSKDLDIPITSASMDKAGYVSLVGYFNGLVDFDPGTGIYNMGSSGATRSLYVLQLDSSGNFNWARKIDNLNNAYSPALQVTNDGARNLYITGSFKGTVNFDPQGSTPAINSTAGSGFILKYNYYGSVDWVKQVGQNSTSQINCLALDDFGNLYTGGAFAGTVDFDPGSGVTTLSSFGNTDVFVHKLGNEQLVTGIKQQSADNNVSIFPNPTTGMVYIQLNKNLEQGTCRLTDINGRIVQENKNISGFTFALNLSEQAKGIYILEMVDTKTISRVKVVKE